MRIWKLRVNNDNPKSMALTVKSENIAGFSASLKSKTDLTAFILPIVALAKVLLHVGVNATTAYGYFRDEFYYIACSEHLSLGYVDQPPFSIYLLKLSRFLFGDSLVAIRLLPAICGAAVIYIAGLMVRKLGGGRFAEALAALAVLIAPIYLAMHNIYSMNVYDHLFWTLAAYLLISIIDEPTDKKWAVLGIVLGLGLLNKISVLWLGAGILVGLLASPYRKLLLTRGPYLAAFIALLIFLPFVLWQWQQGWPMLEFMLNASSKKYVERGNFDYFLGQLMMLHPIVFPIWFSGLGYFLLDKGGRRYVVLGIIYLTVLLILTFNATSKAEYLAPAYPMLFAGGAVLISRWIGHGMAKRSILLCLLIIFGALGVPLALPILPVESYIVYAAALGKSPSTSEKKEVGVLSQFYADMHGWEEKAIAVSKVYRQLDDEEQKRTYFFGSNYGQAGAIDFYRKDYPLPPAVSGHNHYWFWPPHNLDENTIFILFDDDADGPRSVFREVEKKGFIDHPYAMPYENKLHILLCTGLKHKSSDLWPQLKHYD